MDKLRWMNGEYIRALPEARILEALTSYLEVNPSSLLHTLSSSKKTEWLRLYRDRCPTFGEMELASHFLFESPHEYAHKPARKHLLKGDGLARLKVLSESVSLLKEWSASSIETMITELMDAHENHLGQWAMPLRIAIAGTPVTPSIYETLCFMTQEEVVQRLESCHRHFSEV